MPRKGRKISNSGIYHILIRGINQQRIFEQAEDYEVFLDYLAEVKKTIRVRSICILPDGESCAFVAEGGR
jgi:REP element-mobilizing transposase RayT